MKGVVGGTDISNGPELGCGAFDIHTDTFLPNEGPPESGQDQQLQRHDDGEMAQQGIASGLHAEGSIKMCARNCVAQKPLLINGLEPCLGLGPVAEVCQHGIQVPLLAVGCQPG